MSKREYEALSALLEHELSCQERCQKCVTLEARLRSIRAERE